MSNKEVTLAKEVAKDHELLDAEAQKAAEDRERASRVWLQWHKAWFKAMSNDQD